MQRSWLPQQRALLDAIAGSESPGYNVLYGGETFSGYGDHPRRAIPIKSGPNTDKTSSAAGRYQFLGSTWDEQARELGLTDFSPENQDTAAWHLADKTYRKKTGRDLTEDLTSPERRGEIGKALSGVWTSLPGGIEPNSQTSSFAERLGGSPHPTDAAFAPPMSPNKSESNSTMELMPGAQPKSKNPFDSIFGLTDGRAEGGFDVRDTLGRLGMGMMAMQNPDAAKAMTAADKVDDANRYQVGYHNGTLVRMDRRTGQIVSARDPNAQGPKMNESAVKNITSKMDIYGTLHRVNTEASEIKRMLDTGELDLGPVQNAKYEIQNRTGKSTPQSQAYAKYKMFLQSSINDNLRQNNGVQTEGDAYREMQAVAAAGAQYDSKAAAGALERMMKVNRDAIEKRGSTHLDAYRGAYGANHPALAPYAARQEEWNKFYSDMDEREKQKRSAPPTTASPGGFRVIKQPY